MTEERLRLAVRLLTGQAFAFGVMCALLIIPANAIFLDTYGSKWLPATYIAVAVAGAALSAGFAHAVRRYSLAAAATAVLAFCAVLYLGGWVLLVTANATWTSMILVLLFPIQLQLGFVFIGGQAGHIFDVHQIKTRFPRIVAGFPFGFFIGGLLGPLMIAALGATHHLLLGAAVAQLAFIALLLLTTARFDVTAAVDSSTTSAPPPRRPPLRHLVTAGFVALVLGYQVLSAMGSQVLDFLVFDRAAARYASVDDLAQFVAWYTAALNLLDIVLLALFAGALLKRFGLRLGLTANPALVTALVVAMTVGSAAAGGGSLAVFGFVVLARIFDISLTDAMTRTSIAATYQVIPPEERVAVQAAVEGIGVPLAIGLTGVVLLVAKLLDLGIGTIIGLALVLCALWTIVAVWVYRRYGGALADHLRRRSVLDDVGLDDEQELAAARRLIEGDDAANVRLGMELVAGEGMLPMSELVRLADHDAPEVRLAALARLRDQGADAAWDQRLVDEASAAAHSPSAELRRAAALALGAAPPAAAVSLLGSLLVDGEPSVRRAALSAIDARQPSLLPFAVAALDDPDTAPEGGAAIGRLGDVAVTDVAADLQERRVPAGKEPIRLLRSLRPSDPARAAAHVGRLLRHPDRSVSLEAARVLQRTPGAGPMMAAEVAGFLDDTVGHASACLAAMQLFDHAGAGPAEGALVRALHDELERERRRMMAGLAVLHGVDRVEDVENGLRSDDSGRRALALELLGVVVGQVRVAQLTPVIVGAAGPASHGGSSTLAARLSMLREFVDDPDARWRSFWLQACALRAAIEVSPSLGNELARPLVGSAIDVVAETAAWARDAGAVT